MLKFKGSSYANLLDRLSLVKLKNMNNKYIETILAFPQSMETISMRSILIRKMGQGPEPVLQGRERETSRGHIHGDFHEDGRDATPKAHEQQGNSAESREKI